jgi:hypothetical protein
MYYTFVRRKTAHLVADAAFVELVGDLTAIQEAH